VIGDESAVIEWSRVFTDLRWDILLDILRISKQTLGGGSVTVWSGKNSDAKDNQPFSFFWMRTFIWNDKGDNAQIIAKDGTIVDEVEGEKDPVSCCVL
jgi:hypothetical protein